MSKFVKSLISKELRHRLDGVNEALLVSVAGLDAIRNSALRAEFRKKNINLMVVKNSLARRAMEGTPLATAFEQMEGSLAVVWGSTDIVSLAKEITRLADDKKWAPFENRGGVLDGAKLTPAQVKEVSKWPTREEQLSLLLGQILGPGGRLASQLTSMGGALVSQLKQLADKEAPAEPAAEASPGAEASAPPAEESPPQPASATEPAAPPTA